MTYKNGLWAGLLMVTLVLPGMSLAGSHGKHDGSGPKHEGSMDRHMGSEDKRDMKKCMGGGCPGFIKGTEIKVKNIKNGAVITITAKDKDTIKKIQEKAQKKIDWKEKQAMAGEDRVTCPVMGSTFPKEKAAATREYKGKTYYLCCEKCIDKFDKDPEKYAN